ncbi:MAG: diguanylate cyclase [Methylophilales bacterium 28-44-11]|jgi:diguanylate cyclase (GGDEF)-like protein|nr:MAG: diguanylate cyclase [Methylophilales bacterium 28-44-11]
MTLPAAHISSINQSPTVKLLMRHVQPSHEHDACLSVLEIFQKNPNLFAIPVVNSEGMPLGIVDRHLFVETFIKPYARELYAKRKISEFMVEKAIVVDMGTTIDDVSKIIIDAGMQHMVIGFIITENGLYVGLANGHDLLNEIMQRKQEGLFYLAHFDQLTNLPNRLLFMDRLTRALGDAHRKKSAIGLLFIDLDNFKNFNDSMGHGFGDQILIAVANRLTSCAREVDTVARLSGDEFIMIIEDIDNQNSLDILCHRILDSMKSPWEVMGRNVFLTASIGTSVYPHDSTEAGDLILKADAAMYEAKRGGRNAHTHFKTGMRLYSMDKMTLENDLRLAIERNEFELFYQPQVSVDGGGVIGMEALIRWNHPERGLLTPIHFIEIAEKTGLIIAIGKWVVKEACRQHQEWIQCGYQPLRISVNISPLQFYQTSFCEDIRSVLAETGMMPSSLELELTEGMFMHNIDNVVKVLNELHDLGVLLAIDDFGTGYSNLSYLKRFPIDRLKIDQSFVRGIENESTNMEIVRTISNLAKTMSLELVAEGVETADEMNIVGMCGCDFMQGYKFSKPLSSSDFLLWRSEYESTLDVQTVILKAS